MDKSTPRIYLYNGYDVRIKYDIERNCFIATILNSIISPFYGDTAEEVRSMANTFIDLSLERDGKKDE